MPKTKYNMEEIELIKKKKPSLFESSQLLLFSPRSTPTPVLEELREPFPIETGITAQQFSAMLKELKKAATVEVEKKSSSPNHS